MIKKGFAKDAKPVTTLVSTCRLNKDSDEENSHIVFRPTRPYKTLYQLHNNRIMLGWVLN